MRSRIFGSAGLAAAGTTAVLAASAAAFFGELDPSFSGDGRQVTDGPGAGGDAPRDMAIQTDGKIVVVGRMDTDPGAGAEHDFAVVRYEADGDLDDGGDGPAGAGFGGGDGLVTTSVGGVDVAGGVTLQGDGKIIVAGESAMPGTGGDLTLLRYNADGTLDDGGDGPAGAGFAGGDGFATVPIGPGAAADYGVGVQQQGDGKIAVAGGAEMGGATGDDFAVVRFNADGSLDSGFDGDSGGGNGIVTIDFSGAGNFDFGADLALEQTLDAKIVLEGTSEVGGDVDFALARVNSDGTLDDATDVTPATSFDGDGRTTTSFPGGDASSRGVVLQADGKIVAAGFADGGASGTDLALTRHNTDGTLDATFDGDSGGGNGIVRAAIAAGGASDFGQDVAIQSPGGQIVVAGGLSQPSGESDQLVARLNAADGSLDDVLGGDGSAAVSFAPPASTDVGRTIAIQGDGRILVAGEAEPNGFGSGVDITLARLGPDVSIPETTITSAPSAPTIARPTFAFESNEPGSTFECRIDAAPFAPCSGAGTHTPAADLTPSNHTFEVRATDPFAHTDPTPAVSDFAVGDCRGRTVTIASAGATISGTPGNDVLEGTKQADVIDGGGGRDTIRGLGGDDQLCGGPGRDRLIGGGGRDRLIGEQGADTLRGGPGKDRMIGGPGRDRQQQ